MALKSLGEKSCEIKGGGQNMAAMMLMLINFNNAHHHFFTTWLFCVDFTFLVLDKAQKPDDY